MNKQIPKDGVNSGSNVMEVGYNGVRRYAGVG